MKILSRFTWNWKLVFNEGIVAWSLYFSSTISSIALLVWGIQLRFSPWPDSLANSETHLSRSLLAFSVWGFTKSVILSMTDWVKYVDLDWLLGIVADCLLVDMISFISGYSVVASFLMIIINDIVIMICLIAAWIKLEFVLYYTILSQSYQFDGSNAFLGLCQSSALGLPAYPT